MAAHADAQCQQAKLVAPDTKAFDEFGAVVALGQDYFVAGAPFHGNRVSGDEQGCAELFVRNPGWTHASKIVPSSIQDIDRFPTSLAASRDTVIAGTQFHDGVANDSGGAWIFRIDGSNWTEEAALLPTDGVASQGFGFSAAIDGDTAICGAPADGSPASHPGGAAYVFVRRGGTWSQQAELSSTHLALHDEFGCSVAVERDLAIIGARLDDQSGNDAGAIYVFQRAGDDWTETARIPNPTSGNGAWFGEALALSGDYLLVGAPYSDPNSAGRVYVFHGSAGVWTLEQQLSKTGVSSSEWFGSAVSIDGDLAFIGAPRFNSGSGDNGAVFSYRLLSGTWQLEESFFAGDPMHLDYFGAALAQVGDEIAIAAGRHDTTGPDSGAAYLASGEGPEVYCIAKTNSLGCVPSIDHSGSPTLSGNDDFFVRASNLINNKSVVALWSFAPAALPFGGGVLCVQSPQFRVAPFGSGGNPPPNDCSGSASVFLSHAFMASKGWTTGSHLFIQFWSRDPGFAPPDGISLSDALRFVICE
jgi:hypothetical protein